MRIAKNKRVIENAVVGIVDMVSSTQLSNAVDIQTDWEIKERFVQAAQERARQTGMKILNLTGDGFLFLANPKGGLEWASGLRQFQILLVGDYHSILREYREQVGAVATGIRFGIAQGSIIVGHVGELEDQGFAVGAAINLAARLCASANVDEMAMSSTVWEVYGTLVRDAEAAMCAHSRLKGFDHVLVGFHVMAPVAVASKRDTRPSLSHRWAESRLSQAA